MQDRKNRGLATGAVQTPTRAGVVPREVQKEVLRRLEPEQRRYVDMGAALSFQFEFRQEYLYIAARESRGRISPLCRLGYTGDPDRWEFEIFMYSRMGYDVGQDFPTGAESPEDCLAVAADFYLLQYDPFEAGSSRDEVPVPRDASCVLPGQAALSPPLEPGSRPAAPERFLAAAGGAGQILLSDMDAFLAFIEGRSFDLAPRTLGLRRQELSAVNALMAQPAVLGGRAVQSDAPRVQCCFAVAEALGLLRVAATSRRAEAIGAAGFRSLEAPERLWAMLEPMWQRVRWAKLRPRAFGDADAGQAGRFWLGAELGRRTVPLQFDQWLTSEAEVLEVFLFPFWRDAGLLELVYDKRIKNRSHYPKRATGLARVEVTELGRIAFACLSEASPGSECLDEMAERRDGRWQGSDFLSQTRLAGLWQDFDPSHLAE